MSVQKWLVKWYFIRCDNGDQSPASTRLSFLQSRKVLCVNFFFQRCERNYLLSPTGWFLSELCSYQSHRKLVWLESEALLSVSTAEKKVNKTREREKYFFRRKSLSVTSLLFPVEIGWKLVLKYSLIAVQWQYSRRMFSMDGINVWLILLLMLGRGSRKHSRFSRLLVLFFPSVYKILENRKYSSRIWISVFSHFIWLKMVW